MPMYFMLSWAAIMVATLLVLRWGASTERAMLLTYLAACLVTPIVRSEATVRYGQVEVGVLIVDTLAFVALVTIAIRSGKSWPLWVAALHGLSTLSHVMRLVDPAFWRMAYSIVATVTVWPIMGILATVAIMNRRHVSNTPNGFSA